MHEHEYVSEEMLCVLAQVAGEDNVLMTEPMREHTTFKIGGPADVLVTPRTADALVRVLDTCYAGGVPVTIAGIEVDASHWRVTAEAGALLRDVALAAADQGLSGMEPLWGIPATVGGACFMNAGAYDGTTGEVLESVRVYVPSKHGNRGSVVTLEARDLNLGYRKSRVHDDGLIVISATFKLSPASEGMIRAAMDDYQRRREEKQPLEMASAGSTFKRPEGYFAGKLIMDAGLRGACVGDAQVSEKHCGFVVNTGRASAKDVLGLIEHVQSEVKSRFGVDLEPEVRMIGEF